MSALQQCPRCGGTLILRDPDTGAPYCYACTRPLPVALRVGEAGARGVELQA